MADISDKIIFTDLIEQAKKLKDTDEWEPFRPGVTAHWLYKEEGGGASAVLLRYEPGARVAVHEHVGYEHMFVIDGDEYDEYGSYPAGSFVINPPGTKHSPGSKGGCVALLIYEKAVRFVEPK
jgi:anti-sigma factor ChrR (cupin superfamily)